jgi:hypothetical protein
MLPALAFEAPARTEMEPEDADWPVCNSKDPVMAEPSAVSPINVWP